MARRWLMMALLAGCYHPTAATDVRCSASGACPTGQLCVADVCVPDGTQPTPVDSRAPDDGQVLADGQLLADARPADASIAADAHPPGPCDPTKPFGAPVLVAGLNNTSYVANARLSADELEVFFQSKPGIFKQIYTATRATTQDAFGAWTLMALNDPNADNYDQTLSRDGVTFVFASPRSGGLGSIDIWRATRPTPTSPFGAPSPLAAVDTPNIEDQSYVMGNNAALWYTPTIGGNQEIYEALPNGSDYGAGVAVAELNSSSVESFPTPSADGTVIYFGSSRAGNRDIYVAYRASTALPFGTPTPVTELNGPAIDEPSWLSPDLCRLYLSSTRLGQANVFVATR